MASSATSGASRPFPRRFVLGLFAAALLVNIWALTRYWNESLRDGHEFRQFQTALTAYYFKQDGFKLAYETPVLGAPWSIPMEFPLYQIVVAKFSNATGVPLEQSGRSVSILFFYAALPAVWLLLRRRLPDTTDRVVVISAVLLCPIYLFYSRTFMIESTALCLSLWFLFFFEQSLDQPRSWRLIAAWMFGALAALTKVTTFAAFAIACALLLLERILTRRRAGESLLPAIGRPLFTAILAASVPLAAGVAWVLYSDHVKELNPYGHFITSGSLRPFNLGTLAQRATYEWWRAVGYISFHNVLAWPNLFIIAAGLWFAPSAHRRLAAACLLSYPAGCLLFANLYYIHDYYSYASAIFLLGALGVSVAGLLRSSTMPRSLAGVLLVAALAFEVFAFRQTYYSFYQRPNEPVPVEAAVIRAITPVDDVIAGFGFDWNSLLPYYTQRRAIMPFASHTRNLEVLEQSLARLDGRRVSTLLVAHPHREERELVGDLLAKLRMSPQPIARTESMDIYVRKDRATAAVQTLMARPDWGMELNLKADANVVILTESHDLAQLPWTGYNPTFSPLPFRSKGKYEIGFMDFDGSAKGLFTQAPVEIHFQPPAGSHSIDAISGMLSSAYTGNNKTAGVVIQVLEELPDGTRRVLFDRLLTPTTDPDDRGDVVIAYRQEKPFTGTLVFAHYAVPSGNVNFSWGYWKRVIIR